MKAIKKTLLFLDKWLFKVASAIIFVAMLVLIVSVFLQVFTRYALRNPLFWTTEVSCFMLVYMIFLGASIALRRNEHVALDPNLVPVPPKVRSILDILSHIAVYAFILFLFYFGLSITIQNAGSLSEALKVSYAWLYGVLPVSCVLMFVGYTVRRFEKYGKEELEA